MIGRLGVVHSSTAFALRIAMAAFTVLCVWTATADAESVAILGDASIAQDSRFGTWTVSAGGAQMTVLIDASQDYALTSFVGPSGTNWLQAAGTDTIVTVDGVPHAFGRRADGFGYASATARGDGHRLQLDATFVLRPQNLSVTRHIAVVPGSPTFEVWTTFQAMGNPVTISNIDGFRAVVAPGTVHWVTGEQPLTSGAGPDTEFARQAGTLAAGQSLAFGSTARSSTGTVPWLAIDGAADELYAALMWSGGWTVVVSRTGAGLSMDWGLGTMSTVVGGTSVEGPHVLVGLARGTLPAATEGLRTYFIQGLRGGRPLTPLITYNTWYAYGTAVDEASMQREMASAAALGVELFVIDAGWYTLANTADTTDFTAGLGTWTPDPNRFPNGLRRLSDTAHGLGMKFGIWVEPERIDVTILDQLGLDESSLATTNGSYGSNNSAMICLSGQAGRQFVLARLTALIDAAQPDYLKWDNNLWVNCDRAGHGHGPSDGSFAHVTALYGVLDTLRQRYPRLLIENCSGGGNRLDFGMMQYTDVAWMDDQTAPSVTVRHNLEGLSLIFPTSYLLSFLTDLGWEPLHHSPDLLKYARSRMGGVFGLSFRSAWLTNDDLTVIGAQIALVKRLRPNLTSATATLLTRQASSDGAQWDILQEAGPDGSIVLFAFESVGAASAIRVVPSNLQPGTTYLVVSADSGPLGQTTGADLMSGGILLQPSRITAAHLLSLVPQP